jgi:hypothetical protein
MIGLNKEEIQLEFQKQFEAKQSYWAQQIVKIDFS